MGHFEAKMMGKNPEELRALANDSHKAETESYARCQEDGFLSQWAHGITARLYEREAIIRERGGAEFEGLYDGDRRVAARMVYSEQYRTHSWLLREDEITRYGRKYIPCGERSRIQKALGLRERVEIAPAKAKIMGGGHGMSGAASCYVGAYRTGCPWGMDARLA